MLTKAEIIAVGTELLLGQILNTNAKFLSESMAQLGINMYYQCVVGDNPGRMAETMNTAKRRADLIVVSGGLGPTMDDITKDVLAEVLGRSLKWDESVWGEIDAYFQRTGRLATENNKRQAYVIDGAIVLHNSFGTAPGMIVEDGAKVFVLLPGPPRELVPMWNDQVVPFLYQRGYAGAEVIHSRMVRICGIGESTVEDMVKDLMSKSTNPTIAPYAHLGEVHLRVTARTPGRDEAQELVEQMVTRLAARLGDNIFGFDSTTLEEAVGKRIALAGLTLAVAESCTGGLLGHRLTSVPGSSEYFMGGVIAYSNEAKVNLLGVKRETLRSYGAVSKETAVEMALGVTRALGASVGVSITGIAGPGGGSAEKPVGTVHSALALPSEISSVVNLFRPPRADIKWRASQQALTDLWLALGHRMKEL